MLCIKIVEHGNVTIVLIDFTNQIWLKIALEPDRSNRSTKIETRKLRITKKFSCERGIKNKVVNKICVLLKNSYNFEPIMCLVIESVIIDDIAGTFLSQLSLSYPVSSFISILSSLVWSKFWCSKISDKLLGKIISSCFFVQTFPPLGFVTSGSWFSTK